MWILLISVYALDNHLGQTQSKGVVHAPQHSYEQCQRERDRVQHDWHLDGYRVSPRCIWVKHYSTNNGAYNSSDR